MTKFTKKKFMKKLCRVTELEYAIVLYCVMSIVFVVLILDVVLNILLLSNKHEFTRLHFFNLFK